jgi:hypothetical protein
MYVPKGFSAASRLMTVLDEALDTNHHSMDASS